jgi:thioredoxin-related protein
MKRTLFALLAFAWISAAAAAPAWMTDMAKAQAKARQEKKAVLVNFTGSDWCGWCKKLQAEVFQTEAFAKYAGQNLVLLEVDFPRQKQLLQAQKDANQKLKDQYSVRGFPTIVLLDAGGKELWRNPGYMPGGPQAWIGKIEKAKASPGKSAS